jgi:hypothetical protein
VLGTLWVAAIAGLASVLPVAISPLWRLRELPSHEEDEQTSPADQKSTADAG